MRNNQHLEPLMMDGATVRHGRRAYRAAMGHPRREQAAREPRLVRHAADVSEPPELPASDVELDGVQPQPLSQLLGRDVDLGKLICQFFDEITAEQENRCRVSWTRNLGERVL